MRTRAKARDLIHAVEAAHEALFFKRAAQLGDCEESPLKHLCL